MAAKKHTLQDLIGKQVRVKDAYKDKPEGPFTLKGIDQGFMCLEINGEAFWWSMNKIEGLAEWKEEEIDSTVPNT